MGISRMTSTQPRLDRRQQRTRAQLRDALISLILERGFDALTIQDITDRADLRRATFYMHYGTKEELLLSVLREAFDALVAEVEPFMHGDLLAGKTSLEPFRVIFQHVAQHADLYRVILGGRGGAEVARSIRTYLAGHVGRSLAAAPRGTLALPAEVLANYIAGAELGFIAWWLESGQPYPPEQMAVMAQQLILHGVMSSIINVA